MGKLIDLTNQVFGELTVLRQATKEEIIKNTSIKKVDSHAYWWVQCSCGAQPFIVIGKNLRNGITKSCGHLRNEIGKYKIKDLKGQTFGSLQVLNFVKIENHRAIWHCKCKCGNEKNIPSNQLLSGQITTCGCHINKKGNPKNISNQQFGYLQPLYIIDQRTSDGHVIWHCKCLNCNKEKNISSHSLQTGIISCGCLTSSKGEEKIKQILINNNIPFEQEKSFDTCQYIKKLRFDFFIDNKYLIEYDGEQHFFSTQTGWNIEKNFKETQKTKWLVILITCHSINVFIYLLSYRQLFNNSIQTKLRCFG